MLLIRFCPVLCVLFSTRPTSVTKIVIVPTPIAILVSLFCIDLFSALAKKRNIVNAIIIVFFMIMTCSLDAEVS